jgi:ABC-type glycerol-3-phosphate transport system substrate-binding protein
MVTMRSVLWSDNLVQKYGRETLTIVEASILKGTPHYFPYIPEANDFFDRIGTAASNVISGKQTADQALNELQNWALDVMTKAGYYK